MNPHASPAHRLRRALLWGALVALVAVAQGALTFFSVAYEDARAQDEAEASAAEAATAARRALVRLQHSLQTLPVGGADGLLRERQELRRVEWRDEALAVLAVADSPYPPVPFRQMARRELQANAAEACAGARRTAAPSASASYFMPHSDGLGSELVDLCVPLVQEGRDAGYLVASVALAALLEGALGPEQRRYEFSFVESDGTRLARVGTGRGAGVYRAERIVDLPGHPLLLRADSTAGRPSLIPNLATALVLGLSIALAAVLALLARDLRRRTAAERALAEALGLRRAMEESLPTGLRARDMQGRVNYANPAFCAMVGFTLDELREQAEPPYWPPELAAEYAARQAARQDGKPTLARSDREAREGFETVFMRKGGERFPVMIFEAPLRAGPGGMQTGWMSAVLDLSAQRRVEDLSRQQQERLSATARLAMVGEMASLLSHELNQPLAAIASYAAGSLNLLDEPAAPPAPPLRQALARIAEQAERAGRVIKSVHHFVRRREQAREAIAADVLLEGVLPLVRLQARKSGTRIEIELPVPAPRVLVDRTMLEQVLLNLARNGIQAMEDDTPAAERVLTVRVAAPEAGSDARRVRAEIADAGRGIAPEVAARLFTPFFTTRSEGMGLGLSLCRTVIEQHGGTLEHHPGPGGRGTVFAFTLPAAGGAAGGAAGATASGSSAGTSDTAAPGTASALLPQGAESGDTSRAVPAR
jgi:two-component system sensor histidine kinase DctS